MNLFVLSCNHHHAGLELREKLAFASEAQLNRAYAQWREQHPDSELVLLSTCNRVEIYAAADEENDELSAEDLTNFVSQFHDLPSDEFTQSVLSHHGTKAIEHLFDVVCSLDSMVLGEPQIVTQVKDAYRIARENDSCGPLTNVLFQHALAVSARVRSETKLSEGRVSIASVAVGDFARNIFDRFDNKTVLVIGAGEMAEETLRYLRDEGVGRIVVVNRHQERAKPLALEFGGITDSFDHLDDWLAKADLIVSTTGATKPIVDEASFKPIYLRRSKRPLFVLDLAVPRDFAPEVGNFADVYLYSIDDLSKTCNSNKLAREKEWPKAERMIEEETARFMAELNHRATGPVIKRLRDQANEIKNDELKRLLNKLSGLDPRAQQDIEQAFNRLVNKVLHPPLESLREEAQQGSPHALLDALKRLFQMKD